MTTEMDFPIGQYRVILADPPWQYRTRGAESSRHASAHYPTMSMDHIRALPVGDLAADDCTLFLWTCRWIPPRDVADVIDAWGFRFATKAFCWVKLSRHGLPFWGMGYWTRGGTEDCLLATRGNPTVAAHDVQETVFAPVREHSRKPDEVYDRIERLTGTKEPGGKIELFARQAWPGWDCWGLETERFTVDIADVQGALL